MSVEPLLVVDDVYKQFETQDGVVVAVDHMSFNVMPGEFLSVIGPSGCGKSTLFNIMGGLLDGYSGSVRVPPQHCRSLGHEMLAVADHAVAWQLRKQPLQLLLSLDQRGAGEVGAVEVEEIEGVVGHPVMTAALQIVLQC